MLNREEKRLPEIILGKAIMSGNEFGWKQSDFIEVVEAARQIPMAIIGGQIQYLFPDGTCELYWLKYDTKERKPKELWIDYCNRTADECLESFNNIISTKDIEKEALESFKFILEKREKKVNLENHKIFILYFNDSETDVFTK